MCGLVAQPSCFKQVATQICATWERRIDYAIKNICIYIYSFGFFRTYSKIT